MRIKEVSLPGPLLIYPDIHKDERGSFTELWNLDTFFQNGIRDRFVQTNQSTSKAGVLRGMHYQLNRPQAKLLRLAYGVATDIVVDIRHGSPNFGKHFSWLMYAGDAHPLIYVPAGFAHGFLASSETVVFQYFCSDFYSGSEDQYGIRWDDADLGLAWAIKDPPIVSEQDMKFPFLKDVPHCKLPRYHP